MNGSERLDEALRALAQADAGLEAPRSVEEAATAVWRQRSGRQRRRVAVRWGAIAAAAAVVVMGAWQWRWWGGGAVSPVPKQEVARAVAPAPLAPKPVVEAPAVRPVRAPIQRPAGMPSRQAKSLRQLPPRELVTEFIPLRPVPAWDDAVPAQVVRVRVPRSELGRFGLAFPGQFVDGTVRADVLVGQDGMARAVRFVR